MRVLTYEPLSMNIVKKLIHFKQTIIDFFDEYQTLKDAYDSLLLQLTKKVETIQDLQDCEQSLELEVNQLQKAKKKTANVEMPGSLITSSTFDNIVCIPVVCKQIDYKEDAES